MKTSVIRMIVTIAAVGMVASVALAKNGNNGGSNHNNSGGNHSQFKLSSNGNSNRTLGISSSSGGSSSKKVFKLNGNSNSSIHNNIFSSNSNNNNNKKFDFNKDKKDFCKDGKCFPKNCHDGFCYPYWYNYCHSYPSYPCYGHISTIPLVCLGYEPFHCNYVVLPGDTCYSIAFKEYGTSVTARHIVAFNGLGLGSSLTPGRILMLPSVSATGTLTPSGAPIADALRMSPVNANAMLPASPMTVGGPIAPMTGPVGPMISTANTTPVAPATTTAPRPKITVGSMLQVDGQSFGDKPGVARLTIGGAVLKIEVIEWLGSAVKIRLPQLELAGATNAEIEVLRADGSLAAKSPVELSAATEVALAK